MKHPLLALLLLATLVCSPWAAAQALDLAALPGGPIGRDVQFLQEADAPLDLAGAMAGHADGRFTPAHDAYLNFGIGAAPVWLRFEVDNGGRQAATRRLTIENTWLDRLDVHLLHDGRPLLSRQLGDRLPFDQRPVASRFFAVDLAFPPGRSTVYLRVESADPMVLPVYLGNIEQAHARQLAGNYSYGFLYGGLFTLAAYNLMLFFSLKARRYLVYALYLGAFVLMNAAYTGHGYQWLWSGAPTWQQWSNPLLMVFYVLVGFLFAMIFLETPKNFPRQHRGVAALCGLFGAAEVVAIIAGSQHAALLVAFAFVLVYFAAIPLLGLMAWRAGNKSAKYFLIASVTHVSSAAVTALAVWGWIPYSTAAYRAVDVGMMLDAVLLAMALADRFRISQEQKLLAERLAKMDPLTEMNNRRAFYELVQPRWSNGLRKRHAMSVVVLDIDRFKAINDSFGHSRGDTVLRGVAQVLRDGARDSDILARWGGEEFILFLDETGLDEAVAIAERLRRAIADLQLDIDGTAVSLTASFGVAVTDNGKLSLDELIGLADRHLYVAKELGRNRVCSAPLAAVSA